MAVVAEILFRRCNAALPEMDTGTDLFAFHDDWDVIDRVQVKAGQGKRYRGEEGYSVQFDVPMGQLRRPDEPPLFYVLAARVEGKFEDFLIISRAEVSALWTGDLRFGTDNERS